MLYGIEDGILKESTADRLQDKIQTDKIQTAKLLARIGQKQTNSIFWSRLQFFRRYFAHLRFVLEPADNMLQIFERELQ